MKETPILFNGEMVRAYFAGRKTQTRRIIDFKRIAKQTGCTKGKLAWSSLLQNWAVFNGNGEADVVEVNCPYGKAGQDRLWGKETFAVEADDRLIYRADRAALYPKAETVLAGTFYLPSDYEPDRWKPSIFMPRWASRITPGILNIRVERLRDITDGDAFEEGVGTAMDCISTHYPGKWINMYIQLWESINGKESWNLNPWVWVIEFERYKP